MGEALFGRTILIAVAGVALLSCQPSGRPDARPNIVVVMTDDQGYGDLGLHGNEHLRTPRLDAFGQQSLRFHRFYMSPVCAPARASLMTGRYYYRTGVIHTSRGGAKMHGGELTIAEILRDAGYRTGIFGKWHLGDNDPMRPMDQGFEESLVHKSGGIGQTPDRPNSYFDPLLWRNGERYRAQGYCTDVFFDAALAFIERSDARPFFVYLPTNAPHTPLEIADEYVQPYLDQGLSETEARVYGMVENIDENFGRLLDRLQANGLAGNTLVVFLTDNGPQQERFNAGLRGRKGSVYEGGIRVPSFWRWPRRWSGARLIEPAAAHIDVAPTLAAVAGAAIPKDHAFDGANLLPLLDGTSADWPARRLFFQCHRSLAPKLYQNAAVVTGRYKLLFAPGVFNEENFVSSEPPHAELYDLSADPRERNDLAAEQPGAVAAMRQAYENWFADVRSSRNFTPGVIHLGSEHENPAVLCRYQDATYVEGKPNGWSVVLERAGRYRLAVNRGEARGAGAIYVQINREILEQPVAPGENAAVFDLPAGPAQIDIWIQEAGRPREIIAESTPVGDVTVEFLPE